MKTRNCFRSKSSSKSVITNNEIAMSKFRIRAKACNDLSLSCEKRNLLFPLALLLLNCSVGVLGEEENKNLRGNVWINNNHEKTEVTVSGI